MNRKTTFTTILTIILVLIQLSGMCTFANEGFISADSWTAIDGLGRKLPGNEETGEVKEKYVGMFYWTWHYNFANFTAYNINDIMKQFPEAKYDFDNEVWKERQVGSYFWNEPIYGYYRSTDKYVLRKQAELLADAGVDFVMFDCTNGSFTWEPAYMAVCEVWSEARKDGVKTPQIGFMLNFGSSKDTKTSLLTIYKKLYKKEKYKDLWFYWEGKPLIMAHNDILNPSVQIEKEILDFFTYRRNVAPYFEGDKTEEYWGWLHVYPQAVYKNADGTVEQTTVGVAQNADYVSMKLSAMNGEHNMGRSYTSGKFSYKYDYRGKTITVDKDIENSMFYGLNVQQQWDYAISKDPEIIFVTGWNEWIMGRFDVWGGVPNAFPDQFDDENSRDIEPSNGELKDYYYYQLVSNVRRFKGTNKSTITNDGANIDINGDLSQWDNSVILSYDHYTNSTYNRNERGWGKLKYQNTSMRNDIVNAKITFDADNLYFYVRTKENLTSNADSAWMRLFIDTQEATETSVDWEEFEYVVNRINPSDKKAYVERSTGEWNWEQVGEADYRVQDDVLQLCIPKTMLGFKEGDPVRINFKWSDNMQNDGDIMDFYVNGDVAPGGRFTFPFADKELPKVIKDNDKDKDNGISFQNKLAIIIGISTVAIAAVGLTYAFISIKRKR